MLLRLAERVGRRGLWLPGASSRVDVLQAFAGVCGRIEDVREACRGVRAGRNIGRGDVVSQQ